MMQWGGIRAFARLAGEMRFNFYGDQIEVKFESRVGEPWESWLRLKYAMADYWTGEEVEIDDKIFLATTRPPFGGLRWWFVCPHLNRRVRKLYLPLGGRHFWSRPACYRWFSACRHRLWRSREEWDFAEIRCRTTTEAGNRSQKNPSRKNPGSWQSSSG